MTDFEQQIGPFRLHSEVGRTPAATKYRATDSRNDQSVALYVLNPDLAGQPPAVQQFLTTGRQVTRLRHPNIVSVLEVGEAEGVAYIATAWIHGQSIGERLRRSGRTADLETVIHLVKGVAAALDYAHSEGFVHGHLTLGQVYLTDENTVLVDGFAQSVYLGDLSDPILRQVAANGETHYPPLTISPFLAPEQAHTGQTLDPRTDVYSLGAIIYTVLLGRPPFFAEETAELLTQIIEKVPTPPETINPTLPAAMIYVLKSVLAKDPSIRYGSAGELANALQQSSQWHPATAEQAAPPVYNRPQPPRKRRPLLAAGLPLLLIVLFGVMMISIGLGALGDQFAFVRQPAEGGGLMARIRGLLPQSAAVVELTANPLSLTPLPVTTLTPPIASDAGQGVAQAPNITGSTTYSDINEAEILTVTNSGPLTATMTPSPTSTIRPTVATVTTQPMTATQTSIPTLAQLPTVLATANAGEAGALTLDPFNLLTGAVAAGDVIINGNATSGSQVQVQINGKNQGRTDVKATGTWALIVTINEPGEYEITAQTLDAAGEVTETVQRPITVVSAAATAPVTATVTTIVTPTVTLAPSATVTRPPAATATQTAPPTPTLTATHTAQPTATRTNTAQPTVASTPTVTNTAPPTATRTPTAPPTATVTRTPSPTATNTPVPTATNTPLPTATYTRTPVPTTTNTPLPTKTNTPTLTATHTRAPTFTSTPLPTVTNTPVPTLTSTPLPTATNTSVPTATNTPLPTATYTPVPTATNTRVPTATNTPAPPATPTAVTGSIQPISPADGDSGRGQHHFEWSANFTPSAGYAFELVFWKPGQSPMGQGFGMAAPTTNLQVTLDLERLDEQLGDLFDTGDYEWGVLLVRTTPAYERVQYLGGGRRFTYYRDGGGDSGSGGQSSGE